MKLFSGLRAGRRQPGTSAWQPQPGVRDVPAAEVDDDGCAGSQAHAVTFTLPSAPRATITVWAYARYRPGTGTYRVCYRYEYNSTAGWSHVGWTWDWNPKAPLFTSLAGCGEAARQMAGELAACSPAFLAGWGPRDEVFGWDGLPWQ